MNTTELINELQARRIKHGDLNISGKLLADLFRHLDYMATQKVIGETENASVVCDLLNEIDPAAARGALVSITRLRQHTPNIPTKILDAKLFHAARSGLVSLFRHDHKSSLTETQRQDMLTGEDGTVYNAVAIRPR